MLFCRGDRGLCAKEEVEKIIQQVFQTECEILVEIHNLDLPPLTTDDQVPPEGLLRVGGGTETSTDAPWDI